MSAAGSAPDAGAILREARRQARLHALAEVLLTALPWPAVAIALAWRLEGAWPWLTILVPVFAAAVWGWRRWRAMDRHWLARALDSRRPDMEDSAALLLAPDSALPGLAPLQRTRLRARIANGPPPDLRMAWHRHRMAVSLLLAVAGLTVVLLWPLPQAADGRVAGSDIRTTLTPAHPPRLLAQRLAITPPAYTGLPARGGESLSAKVPAGSRLIWTLRYDTPPSEVALSFHDGRRLPLRRGEDGRWQASLRIERGTLYRIEAAPRAADDQTTLHRIDVVPDRPPQVRASRPTNTLSTVAPGQRRWSVEFEASDDHGLAAIARLRITRTQGSGENITSTARELRIAGNGTARKRRYNHGFDLAQLGLVPGDDLIVQLTVADRRTPNPQTASSQSMILRWPPPQAEMATGLDGLARKVMPAYFRSQRQIIIDAEALLKEKPRLEPDRYLQRSDAIGVDQRLLRLRYGQFLGEESEGAPHAPLPTSDPLPTNDAPLPTSDAQPPASEPAEEEGHVPGDGHDHDADEPPQRRAVFGEQEQVLERFGHTHDIPEAATLLDPKTRELLRAALDEMWQSELHLRQARPEDALPYAYRALELIKRVQQSERIYLQKVGVELAPVDASRRLSGERKGLGDRNDPLREATPRDRTLSDAWRALTRAQHDGDERPGVDLDALAAHLATHDSGDGDALSIAAAIDALRRDPDCRDCRQQLANRLWPLLARPPAMPARREAGGRMGAAYLEQLREGDTP